MIVQQTAHSILTVGSDFRYLALPISVSSTPGKFVIRLLFLYLMYLYVDFS